MITNAEILKELAYTDHNAEIIRQYLGRWNKEEKFPNTAEELFKYIKMHKWSYNDFDYSMEKIVREVLPDYMLDIFFELKQFRSNKRNELASTCATVSKIKGYPMETQDDKAFCLYNYAMEKYYNNSRITQRLKEQTND